MLTSANYYFSLIDTQTYIYTLLMVVTFFMIETLRNVLKNITKRSNLWLMLWIFFMNKAGQIEKKFTEKPEDMKRSCDILGIYKKIR